MKFKTYTTSKGNTFKLITQTDNIQIGYHIFLHNENPPMLRSENVEMRNINYIGIHLCASTLPHITKGIDIPKELRKQFPATDWMQVDPKYALCTIGVTTDTRLLQQEDELGKKRLNNILNNFYKFIFTDICAKSKHSLADRESIKKDIRQSVRTQIGINKETVEIVTNWDSELNKLMGETDDKEKKI